MDNIVEPLETAVALTPYSVLGHETLYSPHEKTRERLKLFYHREKVTISNMMKVQKAMNELDILF